MKKRALVSVFDKTGIVDLARQLTDLDWEVVSTGGTLRAMREAGVPATNISDITGFPESFDGRVKTLHPYIHSGILARRDVTDDLQQLTALNIAPIDLVIVNLYPFQETVANPDVTWEDAIENIDIGGPTMLRAAAKNHADVTVVVDPEDYAELARQLQEDGTTSRTWRRHLAAKVFRHTAAYDSLIAEYVTHGSDATDFPDPLTKTYEHVQTLRYGENPHQRAAFYRVPNSWNGLPNAEQLHGKTLSYNNISDANAAWEIANEFTAPAVVAVKHMNPCGVGIGETLQEAYDKAYSADPVSIFGGIVATNQTVDEATARKMHEIFLEIVMAPDFTPEARNVLQQKKNLRLLRMPSMGRSNIGFKTQSVQGGLLVQETDVHHLNRDDCDVATVKQPSEAEWGQLLLAWRVVKHVKSNAIVLVKDNQTIGVGAGQMNRVGAAKIALEQAGDQAQGAVMASDAFFPMPDTMELAAAAGITAVIQPGGSKRDQDSIDVCNQSEMSMVMTGIRHFKH